MKTIKKKIKFVGWAILMIGLLAGVASAQDPSEGLVPTVRVAVPNLSPQIAKIMPPSFEVGVFAEDADASTGRPIKYRFLLVTAQYDTTASGEPRYIRTPFEYIQHGAEILFWDHTDWSDWIEYPAEGEMPFLSFFDLADQVYFLLALQVMDSDGSVSIALDYQMEVFNFQVREGAFRPDVTICEPFLGCPSASEIFNEIAGGQPLNFSWIADASAYGGTIVSYRHGWDLVDPDDPNDPGWAVPAGLEPENLFAVERSFSDGLHNFILRVVDDSDQVRLISWTLSVVPFVDPSNQLPLLVIDQVYDPDGLVNNWQDQFGNPRNAERYRNPYWQFLEDVPGGVADFDWSRDWMDHRDTPYFRDLVNYKAVLCYAKSNDVNQTMFQQFRPVNGQDKYVWLAPYQQHGGNYFQVGGSSMESFLEVLPNYMVPIIFDAWETTYVIDGISFVLGFGQKEMPDGSMVQRGPTLYPYATAGITALDWTSPSTKYIYGRNVVARFDRDVDCVGLKGLALAPDFQANHGVAPGAMADTFFTDQEIVWNDVVDAESGILNLFANTVPFRNDELFDVNITTRPTPIVLQDCSHITTAPGGMCVEPMFTGISRMDWMREYMWAEGDSEWPHSEYSDFELDDGCGHLGLTSYEGLPRSSSKTHGHTYGYFSYKMTEDKPNYKADVYWGFDPYRFDHEETQKAIRWVLDYFGLNINP
jgi:hypothetical protein